MPWVRIDDKFYDHPKWADAPGDSIALWLAAMAWCNRNDSRDGFIPTSKLTGLVNVKNVKRTCDDLTTRHAFNAATGGFVIHDYAEYQQPEKVQRIREQRSENGKKGARSRWQKPLQESSQTASQNDGPNPYPFDDDENSSQSRTEATVAKALEMHADHLAIGKDNPPGYALAIISNGDVHRVKLRKLLAERPAATGEDLAAAYRAGRWPREIAAVHPDSCECGGTGWVTLDESSRTSSRCTVTEWPSATIHALRATS